MVLVFGPTCFKSEGPALLPRNISVIGTGQKEGMMIGTGQKEGMMI